MPPTVNFSQTMITYFSCVFEVTVYNLASDSVQGVNAYGVYYERETERAISG